MGFSMTLSYIFIKYIFIILISIFVLVPLTSADDLPLMRYSPHYSYRFFHFLFLFMTYSVLLIVIASSSAMGYWFFISGYTTNKNVSADPSHP